MIVGGYMLLRPYISKIMGYVSKRQEQKQGAGFHPAPLPAEDTAGDIMFENDSDDDNGDISWGRSYRRRVRAQRMRYLAGEDDSDVEDELLLPDTAPTK